MQLLLSNVECRNIFESYLGGNVHEGCEEMKVSIIVPVYNAEPYLRECIDSLVGQTWKNIEVILVNDGSTDESGTICESYLDDPRVIYHYQKNAGVSAARNAGLALATGEYICFVDSDDWLELDALEHLQNENADIVMYNFYHGEKMHHELLVDGIYNREELYPKMISYIDENGNVSYIFHNICIRLFRREPIENYHIRFNPQYHNGEDLLFTFAATMKADTISVRCSEYLYHYRPVQNSQTTSYIRNYWTLRKKIIAEIYNLIQSDVLKEQMPLRIFSWAVAGIENELRYDQGKRENIREIVSDPVCDVFKQKLDVSGLNEKNKKYYQQICDGDYRGIWKDHQREVLRRKKRRFIKKTKKTLKSMLHRESR